MKKLIALLFLLFVFVGCTSHNINPENAYYGVIKTSSSFRDSRIIFYDEYLNEMHEVKSKTGQLGSHFDQASYYEDYVYFVPRGLTKNVDEKVVIEIDMKTLDIKEYPVDMLNLQGVSANDKYIAVIGDLGINRICLINKETNKVKDVDTGNMINMIVFVNDKLYSFESVSNTNKSLINIYSDELELLESIDITNIGSNQRNYAVDGDKLYFSNSYLDNQDHNTVTVLDTKTNEMKTEELKQYDPNDIVIYGDELIVAHTRNSDPMGSVISVLDKETLKTKNTYDLNHKIMRMEIKDSYLCILGSREDDGTYKLSLFDIENEFSLVKQIILEEENNHYYSAVFVNK